MIKLINCCKNEFVDITKNKDLICFCAGNEFERVCIDYPQITDRIRFVADNYQKGETIRVQDKDYPVIPFESDIKFGDNYIGIITTVKYADEVIDQLDKNECYNGMLVFFPFFFKTEASRITFYNQNKTIPKKIHYCWFGKNDIPKEYLENIETWKRNCPDYEIIRWDEGNYDVRKNSYMKQAYDMQKWAFVPDFARLDIINHYGGIYLDTDVEILRPLDDLLGFKLFCGFEEKNLVAFGLGFGGIANNPILQEMMDMYESLSFINEDGSLNMTASPIYQTMILQKHGLKCDGTYQLIDGCAVFPQEYFSPIDIYGWGGISHNTFSIHKYAATWFDESMQQQKNKITEMVKRLKVRMLEFDAN